MDSQGCGDRVSGIGMPGLERSCRCISGSGGAGRYAEREKVHAERPAISKNLGGV
jgi:hypothetical protein